MATRNTAYQFITTDAVVLENYMLAIYETMTGITPAKASPEMLFIKFVAALLLYERNEFNYQANQNLGSRATGTNLDALAEIYYSEERPSATYASCTMRFYISETQNSAIVVPAGTRVTDAGSTIYWSLPEDAYITAGNLYVDATVYSQTAGEIGNGWVAGDINTIVDVYDYYSACENLTESDGGSDVMTDDEFFEFLRLSLDALSTAGAVGAYEYHTKAVSSEIACVRANSPTPGVVRVYAMMEDGTIASEELKNRILASLMEDLKRPLTDYVEVADPEVVEYDIDLTYYVPGTATASAADIADAVRNAISEFQQWQVEKFGRDINPSKLIDFLMHTGIKRVDLRKPVFTSLRDGVLDLDTEYDLADTIPQVGILRNLTIVNGGVEDE